MLLLQIKVVFSEMKDADNFSNLGPLSSEPVALLKSRFFGYFSTFSFVIFGIVKNVSIGTR